MYSVLFDNGTIQELTDVEATSRSALTRLLRPHDHALYMV